MLDRILEVQRLDRVDIEGIYSLYCSLLLSQSLHRKIDWAEMDEMDTAESLGGESASGKALLQLPHCTKLALLRDWLISATAKDCSIYVTMQWTQGDSCHRPNDFTKRLLIEDSAMVYKIQIGDLDLKPVSKIPYQFHLDQEILALASNTNPTLPSSS